MIWAAAFGQVDIVKLLLKYEADVNVQDEVGLIVTCAWGLCHERLKLIVYFDAISARGVSLLKCSLMSCCE